jgi:hypothetical protein
MIWSEAEREIKNFGNCVNKKQRERVGKAMKYNMSDTH